MKGFALETWTRRRFGLATGGVVTALLALAGRDVAMAKKRKKKPKKCSNCCRKDGSLCTKKGKNCAVQFCLNAPFTIEAAWVVSADHDSVLFVPPGSATTGPFPFIFFSCTTANSTCQVGYPFACMSGDVQTSGSEIATIFQLLPGTYEYWNELDNNTAAGDLTIILRDSDGRVVRQFGNPPNGDEETAWHVFDIDGTTGAITVFDQLVGPGVPDSAHNPSTDVCPD